ncbi:MAG: hypothetical protein JSR17_09935 [Proteobacteria bacterium]|nr:hypothetical protein [Pseudomonadota bacterium]
MLDFRKQLIESMALLETPEIQKHLISADRLSTHYSYLPVERRAGFMVTGNTNHPAFSTCVFYPGYYHYQLKPNQSASKALKELLERYETLIDCGMAISIAYYYALLQAMVKIHGDKAGMERFDAIFGDEKGTAPASRMFISKNGPQCLHPMDTEEYQVKFYVDPFQPLSLLTQAHGGKNKEQVLEVSKPGSMLIFEGDIDPYKEKHPLGIDGGFNCIEVSKPPETKDVLVRTFGIKEPISEAGLFEQHMAGFDKEPSPESLFINRLEYGESFELRKKFKRENVKGFLSAIIDCDDKIIEIVLTAPLPEVFALLNQSIKTKVRQFATHENEAGIQRLEHDLETRMKALSVNEPSTAPTVTPAFAIAKEAKGTKTAKANEDMGWFKRDVFNKKSGIFK